MKKKLYNALLIFSITMVVLQCQSKDKLRFNSTNGYVKYFDTVKNFNTENEQFVYRVFYQKTPTLHNGLIQLKHAFYNKYYYLTVKDKKNGENISIEINDLNVFLNQTDYVMNSKLDNVTIALDSTEKTYIRKSLSFKKGIFFIHIYDTNKNILFDLSDKDIEALKKAYTKYTKE